MCVPDVAGNLGQLNCFLHSKETGFVTANTVGVYKQIIWAPQKDTLLAPSREGHQTTMNTVFGSVISERWSFSQDEQTAWKYTRAC